MNSVQEVKSAAGCGQYPAIHHTDVHLTRSFLRPRLSCIAESFSELLKNSAVEGACVRPTEDGFIEFYINKLDMVALHSLKRFLQSKNVIDKHNLEQRAVKVDSDADEISFIVAHPEIDLGRLYKLTLKDLNPNHLDRHQLVRIIDKERLAAFWDYKEFLAKHGDEVVSANARRLLKAVTARDTIVVNEKNLIERHGNDHLRAMGLIPDQFEYEFNGKVYKNELHYLGFKFSDHRFLARNSRGEIESLLVIPNGVIHPTFPAGTGYVARKDEFHSQKAVIIEHMCAAGLNKRSSAASNIYGFIDDIPSNLPTAVVILPTFDQACEIALQYQGKIESLLQGSSSNFHLDINTGRAITRTLIAGVESRLLAERIPTDTLRAVYSEQIEEEHFHKNDKSGRSWKGLIRDEKGFPTPYILLALRTQFSGLISEKLTGIKADKKRNFLTSPVFSTLNGELKR